MRKMWCNHIAWSSFYFISIFISSQTYIR